MLNEVLPVLARTFEPGHGIDSLLDLIVSVTICVAMEYDLSRALQCSTTALDEFGPGAGKGFAAYATGEDRIVFTGHRTNTGSRTPQRMPV